MLPPPWIRRLQEPDSAPTPSAGRFCNILEADPQRRLRLNINNKLLEEMHPADLADIVEDLSPDDREAIFETIDSEVAAETLSEVDPDIQASILESLETEKAADIVEEMSPDEAADVLAELEDETSEEILEEMEPEPKTDVRELLEFREDSAGGLMNTEYVALARERHRGRCHGSDPGQRRAPGNAEHAFPGRRGRAAEGRSPAGASCSSLRAPPPCVDLASENSDSGGCGREAGPRHRDVRQVQPADAARWWTKRASCPARSPPTTSSPS